jgi:YesN/AraC family two-component response regulator
VLDDDPAVVEILCRSLAPTVRCIDRATDANRAIELFFEHKHSVVVLDLVMPVMSGLDVMRRLQCVQPRTQAIIVSGYANVENVLEAVNAHAFGFLAKPLNLKELRTLVVDAFARYQNLRDESPDREAAIAALYDDIATRSRDLEQAPGDPQLQAAYQQSLARLRSAQHREAELASRAFRDHLALGKGMGYSAIEAARRVLERDKDSA